MQDNPIMVFENIEQAYECLDWWKSKLHLEHWVIHLAIIPYFESPLDSTYMGKCISDHVNNCGMIYLASHETLSENCIMTLCDEKVLVHELLHLRYPSIVDSTNYASAYMDIEEHRKIEELAKSLIMVKYDLPFSWFDRDYPERKE